MRARPFGVTATIAAAVLAATVLVLAATAARPAEAAFPGPSGAIAYTNDQCAATCSSLNVWRMAPDGFGATQLTDSIYMDGQPAVSPDGTKIAFASNRDGDFEIYVVKANVPEGPTNVPRKLTNNAATNSSDMSDLNPDWSTSGKKIVFESNRDGQFDEEIFAMNADGSGQKNLTKNASFRDIDPVFSPDGRKIAFERVNPPGFFRDIFRMRADGTRKNNLTEDGNVQANPAWQPMP